MKLRSKGSVSALALAVFGLGNLTAHAQEVDQIAPAAEGPQEEAERIVVTGTNIAGAAESAALPVEVYTADDSFKQGGQTALEFTKSLSIVGDTVGEINTGQAGYGSIGTSSLNLRGLGGGRTLTILNGRRFSENTNMIPSVALERTEILKDGGAVIYGADATGGVVNFITRDDFDGLQLEADFKAIDSSDGDYSFSALWGRNFDNGNIMFSYENSHRSALAQRDRDWAVRSFAENPVPWTDFNIFGSYLLKVPETIVPGGTIGRIKDFTDQACVDQPGPLSEGVVGSVAGFATCKLPYSLNNFTLVEEVDQQRLFGQIKLDFSDSVRFTGQLAYGKSLAPNIRSVPGNAAIRGPAVGDGTAFQFRTPSTNPHFANFMARNSGQITGGAAGLLPFVSGADSFLPLFFGPGGAPHQTVGFGVEPRSENENWNAVAAFDGDFNDFGGEWLNSWSASMTFNHSVQDSTLPGLLGYRMQQALNGFGGPNCNAPDLVEDNFSQGVLDTNNDGTVSNDEWNARIGTQNPAAAGQNGCMWFNPFADNYEKNEIFGNANPFYSAGSGNDPMLTKWLYDDRQTEDVSDNLTFDALMSGSTPIALPGGNVAWAAGAQWRMTESRESTNSEFLNPDVFPCSWPGQLPGDVGCSVVGEAPYIFTNHIRPERTDNQQYSYFGELQVPVLDRLSFQLAVRREEFPKSDLGATVYKVAGKWDPTDWLALRASFGTNYASPPSTLVPGEINANTILISAAGNKYLAIETETLAGIKPETAEVANVGAIFNFDNMPGNGNLRFSVDYFDFEIIDELKTVNHNQLLTTTFVGATGAAGLINCSATLIERITFLNGKGAAGCTQGVTTGNDVTSIRSLFGNGPGATTSGIDYDLSYSFDALGGDMTLSGNATNILSYDIAAFELNGTEFSPSIDALGFANLSRDGGTVSEWRGNASANYAYDNHNVRFVLRYIQGVKDDRFIGTAMEEIGDFTTSNLYYQYTMPFDEDLTLSLSVENLTDEDPPFVQTVLSYDPFIGNPQGRTYEIGLRKRF